MLLRDVRLTPGLQWWLERAGDSAAKPLTAVQTGSLVLVHGPNGRQLTPSEKLEVEARLAAHRAQPLTVPDNNSVLSGPGR